MTPLSLARIDGSSLEELMVEFPTEWQRIGEALVAHSQEGPQALADFVERARKEGRSWRQRIAKSRDNPKVLRSALPHIAQERLAILAVERTLSAASLGG